MHRVFDSMEEAVWVALFPFSGISQGRWSAMPKMITRNVVDIKEFETECGRRQNDQLFVIMFLLLRVWHLRAS